MNIEATYAIAVKVELNEDGERLLEEGKITVEAVTRVAVWDAIMDGNHNGLWWGTEGGVMGREQADEAEDPVYVGTYEWVTDEVVPN